MADEYILEKRNKYNYINIYPGRGGESLLLAVVHRKNNHVVKSGAKSDNSPTKRLSKN